MESGEKKAWDLLSTSDPDEVCKRAAVSYDPAEKTFLLKSFGADITVSPADQGLLTRSQAGELLIGRFGYFSKLSILWYLTSAKEIPFTGNLVNPVNLRGGQLFFRGSHILPLDRLAEKYTDDPAAFVSKGLSLGGEQVNHGDAAIRLLPLPRIPVVLILWRGDEEFPPRADLLFDSSCESQIALDILWSIAMMSILIMM